MRRGPVEAHSPLNSTSQLLSGRVAVVTGAGRGIGASIATTLARNGAQVLLVSRSVGSHIAEAIGDEGGSAHFVQADVGDPGSTELIIGSAIQVFGRVDILINNAATPGHEHVTPVQDISLETWRKQFAVNLDSCLRLAQAATHEMLRQGDGGRIVNISSIMAIRGAPGYAAYQTAKRALIGLTESLAIELAPSGIVVNAVLPGYIATRQNDAADPQWRERFLTTGRIASGRMGDPDEVANVVLFLSSRLSSYVVGQSITVDGGLGITLG